MANDVDVERMSINADLRRYCEINTNDIPCIASPQPGVYACLLELAGATILDRATYIAKFDAGVSYPGHLHFGGEEIYILSGDMNDGVYQYHEGYYARHPINTSHKPESQNGCRLLVKSGQMIDRSEFDVLCVDTNDASLWNPATDKSGRMICSLYTNDITHESATIERWQPGTDVDSWTIAAGGEELYIIEGDITMTYHDDEEMNSGATEPVSDEAATSTVKAPQQKSYVPGWWIRRPTSYAGRRLSVSTEAGVKFLLKRGHLFPTLMKSDSS